MRIYRWIIGILLACLVIILPLCVLSYGVFIQQWDGPAFRKVVEILPVPAARIGSRVVRYSNYLQHLDAERKFMSSEAGKAEGVPRLNDLQIRQDALERSIRIAAIELYAEERGIVVTPLDVDRSFDTVRQSSGTSTTAEEFRKILDDQFGWTEEEFKKHFLYPSLLEDGLVKKKQAENQEADAFAKELEARANGPDVKRYLKIK